MTTLVTFTQMELLGCYDLARQRNAKRPGVASRKLYDGADDLITNYVAVKAEYAVEKLTGVALNYTITPNGGAANTMTLAGRRCLVRCSDDLLIFNDVAAFDADAAILVSPTGTERDPFSGSHPRHWRRNVVVKGWIDRDTFLRQCVKRNLGYGERLVLRDGQLFPLRTLLDPAPEPVQLALV